MQERQHLMRRITREKRVSHLLGVPTLRHQRHPNPPRFNVERKIGGKSSVKVPLCIVQVRAGATKFRQLTHPVQEQAVTKCSVGKALSAGDREILIRHTMCQIMLGNDSWHVDCKRSVAE